MPARMWNIGRGLQARVRHFFENPPGPASTPLELLHAALDELERRAQPAGRGRRVFPYNRVGVQISQPDADRAAIDAVFGGLDARLRERLAEINCDAPPAIDVRVSFGRRAPGEGRPVLAIECSSDAAPRTAAPAAAGCRAMRVTVLKGQCTAREYVLAEPVIAIGRTAELADAYGRVRRNHVAFLEATDGVTETVGRAHARLQFDPVSGAYYLFDEGSSNATFLLRGGRSIRVAPHEPRGLRVMSGDEVLLGRAIVRLTIE